MSVAKTEFAVLVDRAHADPNIVGLLLAGSRGRGAYITDESDYDTYVILGDGRWLDEYADRFPSAHGDAVEYILLLLESFRAHALPGSPSRWNAYTFAHIEPLIDKVDGEIARIAAAKTLPGPEDTRAFLDGYINQFYRSKKNLEAGRGLEGHWMQRNRLSGCSTSCLPLTAGSDRSTSGCPGSFSTTRWTSPGDTSCFLASRPSSRRERSARSGTSSLTWRVSLGDMRSKTSSSPGDLTLRFCVPSSPATRP